MTKTRRGTEVGRRKFLLAAGTLAAAPVVGYSAEQASCQGAIPASAAPMKGVGRRKLGALEVSSVGLGVQNMSRTYQTTVPSRTEMINIIRTAFDHGVSFYDAAEAYGPHEVERILGEGVAPFRDRIVIASKFGWNIDSETGKRLPGLNSRGAVDTADSVFQSPTSAQYEAATAEFDFLWDTGAGTQCPERTRQLLVVIEAFELSLDTKIN